MSQSPSAPLASAPIVRATALRRPLALARYAHLQLLLRAALGCAALASWAAGVARVVAAAANRRARGARSEAGQTTAEYALVILGAATVALLVLAWATKTTKVGKLLDAVIDDVISKVT